MSRSRILCIVFFMTAASVFTIHLRTSSSKIYNKYRSAEVEQGRLRQELWQQKIRLETLVNPMKVVEQVQQLQPDDQE